MASIRRIPRVKRRYNQWVANQTLEDFALRFTATGARRWSSFRVGTTALGAISFLALEAIGGAVTLNYGFTNAALAILCVSALLFLTGIPICYYAAKYGVDIDLLARGAGFGYIGSTITSLVYATFTFIFFAIEAAIMSKALEMVFSIPLSVGYLISSIIIIPLVTHGISAISKFQVWTQPFWVVLHLLPFIFIAFSNFDSFREWTDYTGAAGEQGEGFNLLLFGAAGTVIFSLIAQIGEQVDFLRFLPEKTESNSKQWWVSLIFAGPGWIIVGAIKLFAGSYLAYLAISHLLPVEQALEPSHMYLTAFKEMVASPEIALALTGIFVVLSQVKINVTNAYAGSIAWSNFFSRLTHRHPGRVVWLVFNVAISFMLMEMGIYKALEQILGLYSLVAVAWVGALVADLVINKPLKLSPAHIEFKRAHLYDINPVGVGAMFIATFVAVICFTGLFGESAEALSSFIALGVSMIVSPLIAWATNGKYYIARTPDAAHAFTGASVECCICEHTFETPDMAHCPAYAGPICSLCCSLDSRCGDMCKVKSRFSDQITVALRAVLPKIVYTRVSAQIGYYLGMHVLIGSIIGLVLLILFYQSTLDPAVPRDVIADIMWQTFIILMIISGVASWLFVLAYESRSAAQEESNRQTRRLEKEIAAHEKTDAALQTAKETADSANLAKSRYVAGLAHEVRTPLNSIYGYAQILEKDKSIPAHRVDAIGVIRRSADHLSRLIEGMADISKIEAGRLHLFRDRIDLIEFLDQIEDMFEFQAQCAKIQFRVERPKNLPSMVYADEKRLRQILINLLTNAVKFTPSGEVVLKIKYRSEIAEFQVTDTGIGIPPEDHERIFKPFERANTPMTETTKGTGLGLAITKLLTEVMGGEISVDSRPNHGSKFTVRLFLSEVAANDKTFKPERPIIGYEGRRRVIMVVDDDAAHRGLIEDILSPLGFEVHTAPSGPVALRAVQHVDPDLFLLDVSIPDMNGWQIARALRKSRFKKTPILMVSANNRSERIAATGLGNHLYVMKPIEIPALLERIRHMTGVAWLHDNQGDDAFMLDSVAVLDANVMTEALPPRKDFEELFHFGQIGHIRAIQAKLLDISETHPECSTFVGRITPLVNAFELKKYMLTLKNVRSRYE